MPTLPVVGQLVTFSPPYSPVLLKGLQFDLDKPFEFDFIVDTGSQEAFEESLKEESESLIISFSPAWLFRKRISGSTYPLMSRIVLLQRILGRPKWAGETFFVSEEEEGVFTHGKRFKSFMRQVAARFLAYQAKPREGGAGRGAGSEVSFVVSAAGRSMKGCLRVVLI